MKLMKRFYTNCGKCNGKVVLEKHKLPQIVEDKVVCATCFPVLPPKKAVMTEDLGKIFEMAICMLYDIPYDGKYKYGADAAEKIKDRIAPLKTVFPYQLRHIAKNGSRYDFATVDGEMYLSAKTNKKDGKVCPQVIGQPSKKKFCEHFGLDMSMDLDQIKQYIEANIHSLLNTYFENTFDCPVIYYNQHKNVLLFVKAKQHIDWTTKNIGFSHHIKQKKWNESSCICVDGVNIGEFQVHHNRDCIKYRWVFHNVLKQFADQFEVVELKNDLP